ncbi:CAP domain-containing protein [Streptomyces sp. DH12]|uniref:CAP domain-containing protein n=1 Tax=Streptomyces sp. DH12 TaxID=2857010 RepID=UPI001E5068A8|nr:CAP domain-containing protein [Streptomyces sp. DH12]
MGRHRRSGAAPAPDGREAYGPTPSGADGPTPGHRGARRRKRALPVRGGLLGASAAMAVGAVAVASGLLPGGETFTLGSGTGGTPGGHIRSSSAPDLGTQGSTSPAPAATAAPASRTPAPQAAPSAPRPSATRSRTAAPKPPAPSPTPPAKPSRTKTPPPAPERTTPPPAPRPTPSAPAPQRTSAPPAPQSPTSRAMAAEAAVLALVNQERATFGCGPVRASTDLGDLARAYSQDMAERGFFAHTDPDGDDPWARAAQAGVEGLAAENIARGQADAKAVMDAWMNSEGHRANILNCDLKRLGVGVHFGPGGPWWTQNFGF